MLRDEETGLAWEASCWVGNFKADWALLAIPSASCWQLELSVLWTLTFRVRKKEQRPPLGLDCQSNNKWALFDDLLGP